MDDYLQPIINVVPQKWRGTVTLLILLSPLVTRAYHALRTGGGIRGVASSIWFGTNTPRESPKTDIETKP